MTQQEHIDKIIEDIDFFPHANRDKILKEGIRALLLDSIVFEYDRAVFNSYIENANLIEYLPLLKG